MSEQSSKAKIAKALIALENHWGGYLIIGFDSKTLLSDEVHRPTNLENYSVDSFNSIVAKFAEPKFHVDVTIQKDSLWKEYPFIRVFWDTQVPVRSCSEDKDKNIQENRYYIRRPWPMSDMPKDGIEWDKFISKCVLKQRREISEIITSFMSQSWFDALNQIKTKSEDNKLDEYIKTSLDRWSDENSKLHESSVTKNKHWYYYFSSQIIWKKKTWIKMKDLKEKIHNFREYTWWPIFLIIRKEPEFISDNFELSLLDQVFESDHSDFWRIWRDWMNFALRGYQTDCRTDYNPGEVFDLTIPVWRLGEYLLHILDLWNFLYEEGFQILFESWWTGLKDRKLVSLGWERFIFREYLSNDDVYKFRTNIWDKEIQDILPLVTQKILSWLYEKFNLFQPTYELYEVEINKMRTWIR